MRPPGGPGAPFAPPSGSPFGGPVSGSHAPGGQGFPASPATTPAAPESLEPVGPPLGILVAAGVVAALGIVLGAVFYGGALSAVGWFLSGPVAIGILALFVSRDTARRAAPVYLRPGWVGAGYVGVLVLVAVGVILGSIGFAMWMGHR